MGEVETVLAQHHGYNYTGDDRVHTLGDKGELESTTAGVVNNTRVTGRIEPPYEDGTAIPPPWGYGDEFEMAAVPLALRNLADRIATCGKYELGPLRDITINGRGKSFFQLDPHLDPAADGPDVFIISMGSSVVLVQYCDPNDLNDLTPSPSLSPHPYTLTVALTIIRTLSLTLCLTHTRTLRPSPRLTMCS